MKKLLSVFLVMAAILIYTAFLPTEAEAATTAGGTCGENLTWTLDDQGTMTISGTGEMKSYNITLDVPWYDYRKEIKQVIISKYYIKIIILSK